MTRGSLGQSDFFETKITSGYVKGVDCKNYATNPSCQHPPYLELRGFPRGLLGNFHDFSGFRLDNLSHSRSPLLLNRFRPAMSQTIAKTLLFVMRWRVVVLCTPTCCTAWVNIEVRPIFVTKIFTKSAAALAILRRTVIFFNTM